MAQALISTNYYVQCGSAGFLFHNLLELKMWLKQFYDNENVATNSVIITKQVNKWDDSVKGFVSFTSAVTADELE